MKEKRNKIPSWLKIAFFSFIIVFLASILALSAICFLSVCGELNNEKISFTIDVSLLVGFLGIAFTVVLATPYFITDNKIDSAVREFVKQEFEPDLINRSEEITKLDAHLSRMGAFTLLGQGYYYWAVGWSFRALKRYAELHSEYTDLYKEFYSFVFSNIIKIALNNLESGNKDVAEENLGNKESHKIKIRAVKDYVDFRYEIYKYDSNEHVRTMKNDFNVVIDEISRQMRTVILSLYESCVSQDFDASIDCFFFRASRYKQDGGEFRKFFYKKIWNELPFKKSSCLVKSEQFQRYQDAIVNEYGLAK